MNDVHSSRPESTRSRPFSWGRGVILGALLLSAGASAAFGAAPEIRIDPTTLYYGAAQPPALSAQAQAQEYVLPTPPAVWRSLREKAESQGSVRVLVRVGGGFAPEGRLDNAQAIESQRRAIDTAQDAVLDQLDRVDVKLNARFEYIPFLALTVDADALDRLAALPEVSGIAEEILERPSLASSNIAIGTNVAVSQGLTGNGQVIAVLDTGVDKTHPFFAGGKVVSEACYSTTGSGTTSLCPGGAPESTAPGSGVSCPAGTDGCNHGTHVAGIAAGNNGTGPGFGVARGAGIIAIQVFSLDTYYCGGSGCVGSWPSDQIRALERVYELADDFDIAAVNMSLGGGLYYSREGCDFDNAARKAAIDNLRSIDVATVISSGNSGYSGYISAPACISSAISVGATDDADAVAYFSNIASFLDLLAPGVDVTSSVPGGGTASFNGTSMAAPHVAGAWAVLKQANPGATVSDILGTLRNTAVSVSAEGVSDLRRINLGKAVLSGPFNSETFTVHNDGTAVLSVLGLELESPVSWIRWLPEAPFDIAPGGSREVSVSVDFGRAPAGASAHRLLVTSTDADESPYPDAVFLRVDKQPCHSLSRSRTGSGGFPLASPPSSPGCPAGRYLPGEVIQLTAVPATGWGIAGWSGTANDASTSPSNTVTMTAGGLSVSVTYFAHCYALTRTHTGSGSDPAAAPASSAGCPAGQYRYAEEIQLTASPAAGWRVGSWTGTDDDPSYLKTNAVVMPASARTVNVQYLEGLPEVLLVSGDLYDEWYYSNPLTTQGTIFRTWRLEEDGEPPASVLAEYPTVLWSMSYWEPLTSTAQAALAQYLDGGGSLFLFAPQTLAQGAPLHPYLGVAASPAPSETYVEMLQGEGVFSGLGPYAMYWYAGTVTPAPGAQAAFDSSGWKLGTTWIGPTYRTAYLTFGLDELWSGDGSEIVGTGLDFLQTVFADVAPKHWARSWIEAIYHAGVTTGCATLPRRYCPGSLVTRDQMAVFLLRAIEDGSYVPPPCTADPFSDVPAASTFCPWIQELAVRGITLGCGNGKYCPGGAVSREQMAIFLMRALEGSGYTPAPCLDSPFIDVPAGSLSCGYIRDLAARGISNGCGGGNFCPAMATSRAEMAIFLVRAFAIPLP
ncbi:MAG TPA: S8 family serine peptidase [Thermoanaerobaculia bacterium]|nr:S8 family serine peptidase [Thermoanaerobaculia bacterium]